MKHLRLLERTGAASALALLTLAGCGSAPPAPVRMPVQLVVSGDAALTRRFAGALDAALRASPRFTVTPAPGVITLTIPTDLGWTLVGRDRRVMYRLDITGPRGQDLGASFGSCDESSLAQCAAQAAHDAESAASRVHR